MHVHTLISSAVSAARSQIRRKSHLRQLASVPNPIVRVAARAMFANLSHDLDDTDFSGLEQSFRIAGLVCVADTIGDLSEVLENVVPTKQIDAQ